MIANTIESHISLSTEPSIFPLDKALLSDTFNKCVQGYHFINSEPINETIWESINTQVLTASGCAVENSSNGSHTSGRDILCAIGGLSNKSAKYAKNMTEFAISSYRLTTICSDKNVGEVPAIIQEINARKNYQYYSFIVRNETDENIHYDWYMIPSSEPELSPEAYTWTPMIGQRGKNKGEQVGWKTNELNGSKMTITFSMSSQLWISIHVTDKLRKFIVASSSASKKPKFNYMQIYDMFSSH